MHSSKTFANDFLCFIYNNLDLFVGHHILPMIKLYNLHIYFNDNCFIVLLLANKISCLCSAIVLALFVSIMDLCKAKLVVQFYSFFDVLF